MRLTIRAFALAAFIVAFPIMHSASSHAEVKLPAIFSDHMVLQADAAVPVWGWAEPGEEVTVAIADQKAAAKAGPDKKWMARLANLKPGGPHMLEVRGKNTLTVEDVLIGEVWLGSGQSNMALVVNQALRPDKEHAAADLPQIRMFTVASKAAPTAQEDCEGDWQVCSPKTVGGFSAALFFCGREIHKTLSVPVGLIHSSVGGTPIESWTSQEAQEKSPELKPFLETRRQEDAKFNPALAKAKFEKDLAQWEKAAAEAKAQGKRARVKPRDPELIRKIKGNIGGLFNGKIAPLIPYAIRGALWYQGEANSTEAKAGYYQYQLPLLVRDWRTRWGYEFPFAWVQLPNYNGSNRNWPIVREAMLKTLSEPKTGMAITIDLGEANDIHPKNKQDVGRRLAMWALGSVYGKDVAVSGPLPAGHERRTCEIIVSFKHTDGGLTTKGGELRGFTIAGADREWKPATAKIEGNRVIVSSPEVKEPVEVRYAWTNNPDCNLYNGAGLPASPFRTDSDP